MLVIIIMIIILASAEADYTSKAVSIKDEFGHYRYRVKGCCLACGPLFKYYMGRCFSDPDNLLIATVPDKYGADPFLTDNANCCFFCSEYAGEYVFVNSSRTCEFENSRPQHHVPGEINPFRNTAPTIKELRCQFCKRIVSNIVFWNERPENLCIDSGIHKRNCYDFVSTYYTRILQLHAQLHPFQTICSEIKQCDPLPYLSPTTTTTTTTTAPKKSTPRPAPLRDVWN